MINWIFPLTILPGICMMILSTTHWASAMATEIDHLLHHEVCNVSLVKRKIRQLEILHLALVLFYISAAACALGGFVGSIWHEQEISDQVVVAVSFSLGMATLLGGAILLIIYAARAVRIKRDQFLDRIKK